jgi:hypothetical protein
VSTTVILESVWDAYQRQGYPDAQISREMALPWQACARLAYLCDRANMGLMEPVRDAEGDLVMLDVDDALREYDPVRTQPRASVRELFELMLLGALKQT